MATTKRARGVGNPAKPPKPIYRPTVWHRDHRFALAGIIGATALTLLAGFLGPSAVTLKLGPRDSYLPPWYVPASVGPPSARMPIHRPTAPTMMASQMRAETNQSLGGPTLAGTYHGGR